MSSPTRPAYCATDVVKRRQSKKKKVMVHYLHCGGHWSFSTFSINFAAPYLGFQILQVLVQGREGCRVNIGGNYSLEKFNA